MRPLRILLVDDDAMIGTLLAELLDEMGHVVCGIEATEFWRRSGGASRQARPDDR